MNKNNVYFIKLEFLVINHEKINKQKSNVEWLGCIILYQLYQK